MNYRKNKDKFMKKYVVIALVAILGTVNAVAQTALSFSGDRATVKTEGKYYIPQSVWNSNQTLYLDIVNAIEPEIGFEEWNGQNSWFPEAGSQWIGDNDAQIQQYIKIDVPGLWTNMYSGNAAAIYVRRIADPQIGVDQSITAISPYLSDAQFDNNDSSVGKKIVAQNLVNIKVDAVFVTGSNYNWLQKEIDGAFTTIDQNKDNYQISASGMYRVRTTNGGSTTPNNTNFEVIVATIPVTGISLNKTSISLTEGEEETLIATVNPDNATNKNVSWSSSNTYAATVDATGKVSAVFFGTAIITATTEDGNYTDECLVEVTAGTALEDVLESTIAIYPNPVKEYLYVTGVEEGLVLLTLVDISGRSLLVQTVANNQYVNISSLPSGAYIVKLQAKDKIIAKKIQKF